MISKKILNISTIIILLSTIAVGAEPSNCKAGVCFATGLTGLSSNNSLKKMSPKDFQKENQLTINYLNENEEKEFEMLLANKIDKSFEMVVDGVKISRFPDEVYRIALVEKEETLVVTMASEKIEDKILAKILSKSELHTSEYYCDNNKEPIYYNTSDLYECV